MALPEFERVFILYGSSAGIPQDRCRAGELIRAPKILLLTSVRQSCIALGKENRAFGKFAEVW